MAFRTNRISHSHLNMAALMLGSRFWTRLAASKTQTRINNPRSFAALIGFQPEVLVLLWRKYGHELHRKHVRPAQILMALSFLKVYASLDVMATIWKISRSHLHVQVWHVIATLRETLDEVRGKILIL